MAVARFILYDRTPAVLSNQSSIDWAWFDQLDPNSLTSPTDTGTGVSTDADGNLEVTLVSTGLSIGQSGLILLDDGTNSGAYIGTIVE